MERKQDGDGTGQQRENMTTVKSTKTERINFTTETTGQTREKDTTNDEDNRTTVTMEETGQQEGWRTQDDNRG